MTDVPSPFTVRKLESSDGGSALQGTPSNPLRYSATVPVGFRGKITSRPYNYDSVEVNLGSMTTGEGVFNIPSTDLVEVALVRSTYGYPDSPRDGVVLREATTLTGFPTKVLDTGLISGRWYYYAFMVRYAGKRWKVAYKTEQLVPVDYAHRDVLFNLLPPFYRRTDAEIYAGTENSSLKRFFETVGYDLDLNRTLTEGIQEMWNPDTAPMPLLRRLGTDNLGIKDAEQVGDLRYRGLVSDSRNINNLRGTYTGLKRFVQAVSKYDTQVTPGFNELLLVDDSEFVEGTGHWAPAPYTISTILNNGLPLDTSNVTITVLPATVGSDFPTESI